MVLCYLEGLTQEQAAAQLCTPLGTIQSRLARGRAKLKARLEQRGMEPSATIAGASFAVRATGARPDSLGRGNRPPVHAIHSRQRGKVCC